MIESKKKKGNNEEWNRPCKLWISRRIAPESNGIRKRCGNKSKKKK